MTSKTRYSFRVQCTDTRNCGARFRLRKRLDDYVRRPRCRCCGGNLYDIEKARRNELAKQERCYCMPIPFPHKKGSLRFCNYHPLANVEATDEEWEDYRGLMETPRSG